MPFLLIAIPECGGSFRVTENLVFFNRRISCGTKMQYPFLFNCDSEMFIVALDQRVIL